MFRIIYLLGFILILTACVGGGSSQTDESITNISSNFASEIIKALAINIADEVGRIPALAP